MITVLCAVAGALVATLANHEQVRVCRLPRKLALALDATAGLLGAGAGFMLAQP